VESCWSNCLAITWSLSQNCLTLGSEMRARTGRVGLLQSDGNMGSQRTSTRRLDDFSFFSTSSTAEAPRRQPAHVGDNRSTKRAFSAPSLKSVLNCSGLFELRYVSGGWPSGVRADHRKCQPSKRPRTKPTSPSTCFLFTIAPVQSEPAIRLAIA
jgi:hypothetical protein